MPIEDIIHITIRRESQTVSKAAFGTVLIAAFHTHWGANEFFRTYKASSALSTLVSEGFLREPSQYYDLNSSGVLTPAANSPCQP